MTKATKKNQKNRAFLAAIAMLIVSAIVITTASFAWFSLGKTAAVSDLDLKVTAKEGIQISANTTNWTDIITFANLKGTETDSVKKAYNAASSNVNNFPDRINPASSTFGTGSLPTFYQGSVGLNAEGKYVVTATAAPADTGSFGESDVRPGYYAFDVYVNYPGSNPNITVDVSQSTVTVDADVAAKDEADDKGDAAYYDATKTAMRIGFANCGAATSTTSTQTLVYNKDCADITSTKPISAVTGDGKSAALANSTDRTLASSSGNITVGSYASATADAKSATLTLVPGVNRVRVYIWMEGQDANCTENLASQYISANLVFEMV